MIRMIKADFYRIFRHVAIYVGIFFMVLMIALSVYMVSPGYIGFATEGSSDVVAEAAEKAGLTADEFFNLSVGELRALMLKLDTYKLDKEVLSVNINLYYVFIFVAAVVIAIDFTSGSAKNTLTSAISRNRYFISKAVTVILVCLLLFFLNTYILYFANLIFNGKNLSSGIAAVTKITLLQIPPVIAISTILVGIAFAVKKTSVYNLITIPLMMVLQLVFAYGSVLHLIPQKALKYQFSEMFQRLAAEPAAGYLGVSYGVCTIVSVTFLLMGYVIFRKSEIK